MRTRIKRAIHRGLRAAGYMVVPLGGIDPPVALGTCARGLVGVGPALPGMPENRAASVGPIPEAERFAEVDALLNLVTPWAGDVPDGFDVDFLGILTDGAFFWNKTGPYGGRHVTTVLPTLASHGEAWFEIADWLYSARAADGQYVAISLGASYGAQLVGAWKALQAINPLPARLVAVDPVPENCAWTRRHMANNGIDPDAQWIMPVALGHDNEPILFPVGAPGTGLPGCVAVNSAKARRRYAELLRHEGSADRVLENIFLYNSTGMARELGYGYRAELKFVSSVTLRDVLSPFDRVDLLEVDIQESEFNVLAPGMDIMNRRVRRVHLGSHGTEVHDAVRALFLASGWEIVFDYAPETTHLTARGGLDLGDGILTARNPTV